jgi:hypothetical protein
MRKIGCGHPTFQSELRNVVDGRVAHPNVVLFDVRVGKSRMRSAEGEPAQASLDGAPS